MFVKTVFMFNPLEARGEKTIGIAVAGCLVIERVFFLKGQNSINLRLFRKLKKCQESSLSNSRIDLA